MSAAESIPFELRAIDADGVGALIGLSPRTVLEKVACRPDFPARLTARPATWVAGEVLYGDRWQSALARDVGVGDRRVREWIAGDRRIPPGVWADIAALLRERRDNIDAVLRKLD